MIREYSANNITYFVEGESLSKDNFLLSPCQPLDMKSRLMILNYKGELLENRVVSGGFCTDFKQTITPAGNILYSYTQHAGKFLHGNGWYEDCKIVLLDEKLNEIKTLNILPFGSLTEKDYAQSHDHLIIDENHYYLLANKAQKFFHPGLNKEVKAINCIIQEISNGEVVWQFETLDYLELIEASMFHNNFSMLLYSDYAHLNAIALSKDGEYLYLSYRNIGLVKVRKVDKKIMWIFGSTSNQITLPDTFESFKFQHDIRVLDDEYFSFFDNTNARAIKAKIEDGKLKALMEVQGSVPKNTAMGGCIFYDNCVDMAAGFYLPKGSIPQALESNLTGLNSIVEYDLESLKPTFKLNFSKNYILYRINRGK